MTTRKLPGFNLPLLDGPDGPLLGTDGVPDWPLCVLVNAAARGQVDDLVERLRGGETLVVDGLAVERPAATLDLGEERERFRAQSGHDDETIDEFGGFVVMDGEPYPIVMIADVYWALAEVRAAWQLEQRRRSRASEAWRRFRSAERDHAWRSSPELLADLERQAALVDELAAQLETSKDPDALATLSVKRRFLLVELTAAGLLDGGDDVDDKLAALARHPAPTLAGYLRAAREFAEYMASPQRAEFAPGLPVYPPTGAPTLSLDWFRKPQPIPKSVVVGPLEWAGWCEREAERNFFEERNLGSGWWYWHSGSVSHVFHYRFEDGTTPALYRVT